MRTKCGLHEILQLHSAALCPRACNGELTHSDKLAAAVFRLAAGSTRSGERRSRGSDTAAPRGVLHDSRFAAAARRSGLSSSTLKPSSGS